MQAVSLLRFFLVRLILSVLFGATLGLPTALGQSQGAEVPARLNWGKEYKGSSNTYLDKVITSGKEGIFMLRRKASNAVSVPQVAYLELYNREMDLIRAREVDLKYKNKLRDLEEVVLLGGDLFLLTSYNNVSQKKNYLFAQSVSRNNLVVSRQLDLIAEAPAKGLNNVGHFDFHVSEDSSRLLVYNQMPYKRKEPEQFTLRVYGKGMERLWEKTMALPYNDDQFLIEEYRVDNAGNVYLLGVVFEDEVDSRRAGRPTYQYRLLAFTENGQKYEEYKVDLDGKFITDLTFRVGRDGQLVCCGFFSEKGTYSIRGTCFFRLDPVAGTIYNQNLRSFEFGFLTEHLSDGATERAQRAEEQGNIDRQPELYNYNLKELVLRSDGGGLLVAEQYFVRQRDYRYFNGDWRIVTYYYYNDIIVVNIKPNGEIEWHARIPKRQVTVDDGGYFSSFAMSIVRDRLYFVFNEHPRNLDPYLPPSRYQSFSGAQSILALAEVNREGGVTRYPLEDNRESSVLTRPKACKQIGRKEMMILGERGKRYRFARLDFK